MTQYRTQTPYIASYVLFKRDGKYAFVLRHNTGWRGDYFSLPSGKVENGESFSGCAIREAQEEVGVDIRPEHLEAVLAMHRLQDVNNYWIDVYFLAKQWDGELYNAEPEKASKFEWLDPHNLPDNVIPNVRFALEQIRLGATYCEYKGQ